MSHLGQVINTERIKDFKKIVEYYRSFKINDSLFQVENLSLLKEAHKFAFAVSLFSLKLQDVPPFAMPYLSQLKSNVIQLIETVALGNKRAFTLIERSIIETLLRYIYYLHHEIEYMLLQIEPSKYETVKELFAYVKIHPFFRDNSLIKHSFEVLNSKYSELSREVHTSTLFEMIIVNDIASLNQPMSNIDKELASLKLISQNVIFILGFLHKEKYVSLSFDEKPILALFLTLQQKRALSDLI